MRLSRFARRMSYDIHARRKRIVRIFTVGIIILIIISMLLIILRIRPLIVELALANATDVITLTVNGVISEKMSMGDLDYGDLVILEKDDNGNVSALVTNMANINILQAEITNAIVEGFSDNDVTTVSIPIGSLVGGALLSGRGPRITAEVLSVTNVNTAFRNEFSTAGINQTRHRIVLDVTVDLSILIANYSATDSVVTEVNIAETVIVGSVPGTYADIK